MRPALGGPEFFIEDGRINPRVVAASALAVVEDRQSLSSQLTSERAASRVQEAAMVSRHAEELDATQAAASQESAQNSEEMKLLKSELNSAKVCDIAHNAFLTTA